MGLAAAAPQVGKLAGIRYESAWHSEGIQNVPFLPHFTNVLAVSVGVIFPIS